MAHAAPSLVAMRAAAARPFGSASVRARPCFALPRLLFHPRCLLLRSAPSLPPSCSKCGNVSSSHPVPCSLRVQMFSTLYGQTAAALYAKAAGQNAQARQLYNASADTYYKANDAAAYDDWVRARNHWDYFYNRS
jgi:hypothetical protein